MKLKLLNLQNLEKATGLMPLNAITVIGIVPSVGLHSYSKLCSANNVVAFIFLENKCH